MVAGEEHLAAGARRSTAVDLAESPAPSPRRPRRGDVVTYRVRIDLVGTDPALWRRLELASDLFLDQVHDIIQVAFGWTDSHLHRFASGPDRFGALTIFLTKYIWGLRWATCIFYGATQMAYLRFLLLSTASCFVWVFVMSGCGYFFSTAVGGLIVDFRRFSKILLVVVIVVVAIVYLQKRLRLSKKVEAVMPERLQEFEQVAIQGLKQIREEFKEKIHLKSSDREITSDAPEDAVETEIKVTKP